MSRLQVLFVSFAGVGATISEEQNQVNPIRRVVSMLEMMQHKISAEGEKKKRKKPCCVCKMTKKYRDKCIMNNDEDKCVDFIEAHNVCLRAKGFRV